MITVSQLRERVQIDPDEDDTLLFLRDQVIDYWESETGGLWNKRIDYVEIIEPTTNRLKTLYLALRPVTSISKVEIKDKKDSEWTEITDYSQNGFRLYRNDKFWEEQVRVTYSGGYDETDCPSDIAYVLVIQAAFQTQRHRDDNIIIKGKSIEGGVANFFEDATMHPMFKRLARKKARLV